MKRHSLLISALVVASGCVGEKQRVCGELGDQFVNEMKGKAQLNYTNLRTRDFYSPVIDGCVHIEQAIVGVGVEIFDTSNGLLKDAKMLMQCGEHGANSVIVEKVRQHNGYMRDVPYSEWLDDGFGGPPATVKSPRRPYDREQCQSVLNKWITFLGQ